MAKARILAALGLCFLAGCGRSEPPAHLRIAGADPARGLDVVQSFGCATCHAIPDVRSPRGIVGPPLDAYAQRTLLAGRLANTPAILVPFLIDPPALLPGTGMPNVGLTEEQARDVAAYLYTLTDGTVRVYPPNPPLDLLRPAGSAHNQSPLAVGAARP